MTDLEEVYLAQRGDKRAFDRLVLKYQDKVLSVISKYVSNKDESGDLMQETFIKAYNALDKFRNDSKFYTWLYRIAINTAKNHLLAKKRRPPGTDISAEEAETLSVNSEVLGDFRSPELLFEMDEVEEALTKAFNNLPPNLRGCILLREVDGLSYEEIAEEMGCPVGTVRSRLHRARELVASELNKL